VALNNLKNNVQKISGFIDFWVWVFHFGLFDLKPNFCHAKMQKNCQKYLLQEQLAEIIEPGVATVC
jgi:hypothetical protein